VSNCSAYTLDRAFRLREHDPEHQACEQNDGNDDAGEDGIAQHVRLLIWLANKLANRVAAKSKLADAHENRDDGHGDPDFAEAGTAQMPREKAGEAKAQCEAHESKHGGERKRVKDGAAGAHGRFSTVKPVCFSGSMAW
jgi:hypothetical protein